MAIGDVLAASGDAHRVASHWTIPLRRTGAAISIHATDTIRLTMQEPPAVRPPSRGAASMVFDCR